MVTNDLTTTQPGAVAREPEGSLGYFQLSGERWCRACIAKRENGTI